MKNLILLILLLFSNCLLAQNTKPQIDMNIKISELKSNQTLELNIMRNNQKVWEYNSKDKSGILNIQAKNWFTNEGRYDLTVYLEYKDTMRSAYEELEFDINGNEFMVNTDIEIYNSNHNEQYYLSDIYLKKYYHSSDSITLEGNWTLKPDGEPQYIIRNNSQRIIHGIHDGLFFGWIEKLDSGKWNRYRRGGFCDVYGYGEPVFPGQTDTSIEGFFIGSIKPFVEGKYKYCVYYSFDKARDGGFIVLPDEVVDKKVWDIYLLEKEFEIKEK